jgi:hypothetical protein
MATTTENTATPAPVTEITQEDLYNAEPQLVQCTEVLADLRKKRKQKGLSEDRIKKLDAQIKKQLQWRKQLEAEAYEFLGETPPESADTERPKPVKKKAPAGTRCYASGCTRSSAGASRKERPGSRIQRGIGFLYIYR